jgi:hypothetical protein
MLCDRCEHEGWHGHIAKRRRSFRGTQHRAAVNYDHLLVNGNHSGSRVDAVACKPECLALAQASTGTQKHKQ